MFSAGMLRPTPVEGYDLPRNALGHKTPLLHEPTRPPWESSAKATVRQQRDV
ncbi:MAG TPA: hypothetical protein PLH74_09850 [Tenuifilaceae bacterium]|nr:hypothetical protein [Tenuifilaceae bacterium]